MKICITTLGLNLDSLIDPRFGRAQYFLLLNEKGKLEKALPNQGIAAMRGAGIAAAQEVANQKVEVLITGNIGPNAFGVLITNGVKIFLGPPGISAREAFKMWQENKLTQPETPNVGGHFGIGPPPGQRGPAGSGARGFGRGSGGSRRT